MKALTFGSLFAGIGGIDLGFERAGMTCKWQVEINEYARRVLRKHWPHTQRWDEIKTFPPPWHSGGMLGGSWRVNVIAAGFPCQDISYAGRGAGLDGERSGLFYEAMRVVRTLGPKYVVLENVAALLTRGLPDVLGTLASLGYDTEWHCVPAAAVGAPHIRDRVFILGYADRNSEPVITIDAETSRLPEHVAETERIGREQGSRRSRSTRQRRTESAGRDTGGAGPICRTKPIRSEWWAVEPSVGRVANGIPRRVDRLRGLGNAVVPQVAEYIGRRIIEHHARQVL